MKYARIQALRAERSHFPAIPEHLFSCVCTAWPRKWKFRLAYLEISLSIVRKWSSSLSSPLVMPSGSLSPSYTVVDYSSDLASPTRILFEVRRHHALDRFCCLFRTWKCKELASMALARMVTRRSKAVDHLWPFHPFFVTQKRLLWQRN